MARRFYIDNEEVDESEFWRELESDVEWESEDNFDDYLNEVNDYIEVCGIEFSPSDILRELDQTAYHCELSNYSSDKFEEYKDDLERLDEIEVDGYVFKIVDEEDEEDDN